MTKVGANMLKYGFILVTFFSLGCGSSSTPTSAQAVAPNQTTEATPNSTQLKTPSDSAKYSDLEITVESCLLGGVRITDSIYGIRAFQEEVLSIRLSLLNTNPTKKLEYYSWRGERFATKPDRAVLYDNFGNSYKQISFTADAIPYGAVDRYEAVYPNKALTDILVFEAPLKKATHLDLELPAENIGGQGMIKLRVALKQRDDFVIAPRKPEDTKEEERTSNLEEAAKAEARHQAEFKQKEAERKASQEKDRLFKEAREREKTQRLEKEAAEKVAAETARKEAEIVKRRQAERKEAEGKANDLLKSAKRWLADGTSSGTETGVLRLKDLLKRFPDSEAAKEGKLLLEKTKK